MTNAILRGCLFIGGAAALLLWTAPDSFGLEVNKPVPTERREAMSLADAVLKALQNNLDISIGRQTRESRLADIVIEQAKFDPTVSLNGQYNRQVSPLNRPILGFTGANLQDITKFDQNTSTVTADITQNLPTGANYDLNYSPQRSYVSGPNTFLFNPAWTGGLALTVTQPLLKNFGTDINKTFISIAQNNATVEQHVFLDRVLTVIASVEQTFWEMVFANENLKVAQAALKAAEELLASNRAKAKAGVMSIVDVLQAEAAVARYLTDIDEPPAEAVARFGAEALARSRAILKRKRVDEALPLLGSLSRRKPELEPLAHAVVACTPRVPRLCAISDAWHIAERALSLPSLADDARRDCLIFRSRFTRDPSTLQLQPRRAPFVGRETLEDGSRVWAMKGPGSRSRVRTLERNRARP